MDIEKYIDTLKVSDEGFDFELLKSKLIALLEDVNLSYFKMERMFLGLCKNENEILLNTCNNGDNIHALFVIAHEIRHIEHHKTNKFSSYEKAIVDDNYREFRKIYMEIETEANEFAKDLIESCGYTLSDSQMYFFNKNLDEDASSNIFNDFKYRIRKMGTNNFQLILDNLIQNDLRLEFIS